MLYAILMMGGLGVIIGSGLAVASKIFYVYVDPLVEKIDDLLPGANCGGCGLPGCAPNAEAIAAGKASPDSCVAGGADLAEAIAAVMGMTIEAKEPDIARPGCTYGTGKAAKKFEYKGLDDCQAVSMLYGGMKICTIGCLGLGSCMRACPFSAIVMGEDGLPVVLEDKCTGCGACERICPKNIIKLSSVTRRILQEYTTDDCTTPCQRACPAGINICEYIRHISEGDHSGAVQIIKERNPFPTVIGRICPRPCENECRRNLVDESVAINYLKRHAADIEMKSKKRSQPYKAPETDRRIAVVGGGVEGLSAAFFVARLGHSPTVYEAESKLGGLLRKAIAEYRLPRDILDWDIEGVRELGVDTVTNSTLGRDFTIASLLKEGFEAVLLASGGFDSRSERMGDAEIEEPVPGVHLLLDVIKSGMESPSGVALASDVIVAGGAEIATTAADICKEQGAKNITFLFKETKADLALKPGQLEALEKTGANLIFNASVTKLTGRDDNLTGIWYEDRENRSTAMITAGNLIIDSGRLPELIFKRAAASDDAEKTAQPGGPIDWEGLQPYDNPFYSEEKGLLAAGAPVTDYSAAIRAIAGGRRSAASVHMLMYDMALSLPEKVVTSDTVLQSLDALDNVNSTERNIMPTCPVSEVPRRCPEIELGYSDETAKKEADRCLRCGIICYMPDYQRRELKKTG